jgi:hypothetical protein
VDDLDELLGSLGTRVDARGIRVHDMIADMVLNHFRDQPIEGTPAGGDLLQYRRALGLGFDRPFNRFELTTDATDPGEKLLLLGFTMGHGFILSSRGSQCGFAPLKI